MVTRAISAIILGAFTLSGSTCGKSTEDPSKDKAAAEAPVVTLEGVDTSMLTPREQRDWSSYVSEILSPCPSVPVPIAQCVKEKRACDKCAPAAKYLVKLVKDGQPREPLEKAYRNRFDADKVKNVPIDGSPSKGPTTAPITLVEFADFQCPHCAQVAPAIDKLVESRKDIRLVYKLYVLGKFPNSENAARAAWAANKQGKFWEMHHAIFANQNQLTQQNLDSMAMQLGLDLGRFHADMQSPETAERIAADKKAGEDLKIEGTPSIFINGRLFDGGQDMNEWIALELATMGNAPAPAADAGALAPSASASSSANSGKPPVPSAPKK